MRLRPEQGTYTFKNIIIGLVFSFNGLMEAFLKYFKFSDKYILDFRMHKAKCISNRERSIQLL